MSVAIISQPVLIAPSYYDHIVDMYDSARAANADLYYEIDIVVGTETRTLKQLPDATKHAIINISKILQSFIESTINVHSGLTSNTAVLSYYVTVRSISLSTTTTATSSTMYVINGTVQPYDTWNYLTWLPKTAATSKFLNNWTSKKVVHLGDPIYLQTLTGTYGATTTNFAGITVTIYNYGGSTVTRTLTITPNTTPYVLSINVGTTALTAADALLVFTNALYYEVKEKNNLIPPVQIWLAPVDTRFDKYFRIAFIGPLGTTEFQNFDLENKNTIKIDKSSYINNDLAKVYNTMVEDSYEVLTDYMNESQSLDLKYLWSSPATAEITTSLVVKPIIIDENSVSILRRRNIKTINYSMKFIYAAKYKSFRQ